MTETRQQGLYNLWDMRQRSGAIDELPSPTRDASKEQMPWKQRHNTGTLAREHVRKIRLERLERLHMYSLKWGEYVWKVKDD